ncbi:MAG TPA: sporulation/spore germination protein [Cyanobacteria bacterium UBA8803]|nr:sporulation/spore germination protein [Cyanobacteria bacterium UBA9273]HBL59954.1 sporulation/spore germination protein [Cyanobacteria bacterium UBA8803]
MKTFQVYLAPLAIGIIAAGFSTYNLIATSGGDPGVVSTDTKPAIAEPEHQTPTPSEEVKTNKNSAIAKATKTIALNIYYVDSQCETLVPEKVAVAANSPVNAAVGKLLERASSSDFDLAGYRVNLDANRGIATIDFRLSPDSKRQFVSLSQCEQFALFGSLRKTLTANPQLKIKEVRFTDQGERIFL